MEATIESMPPPAPILHPNLAELYRREVEELQDVLTVEASRPEAMAIIRSLIERIEVYPGAERGRCDVVLVGASAAILAFMQHNKTAARGTDDGTFLLVAGAHNQRYLHLDYAAF